MNIAFFDFDGTITNSDTFFRFIRFSKGNLWFYAGIILLSPVLLFYRLGLIPNWKAKEIVFSFFFKGISESVLLQAGTNFAEEIIPKIIRSEAQKAIDFHRVEKDMIVVVTASFSVWIKPWCDAGQMEIIATEPEIKDGRVTGLIKGKNCHGLEKVKRINDAFDLNRFAKIYAYGDSSADMEMLNLADEKFLKWAKIN